MQRLGDANDSVFGHQRPAVAAVADGSTPHQRGGPSAPAQLAHDRPKATISESTAGSSSQRTTPGFGDSPTPVDQPSTITARVRLRVPPHRGDASGHELDQRSRRGRQVRVAFDRRHPPEQPARANLEPGRDLAQVLLNTPRSVRYKNHRCSSPLVFSVEPGGVDGKPDDRQREDQSWRLNPQALHSTIRSLRKAPSERTRGV